MARWRADEMRDYLTTVHPFAGKYPTLPSFADGATAMPSIGLASARDQSVQALSTNRMSSTQARQRPFPRPTDYIREDELAAPKVGRGVLPAL